MPGRLTLVAAALAGASLLAQSGQPERPVFRGRVDLVNVTATVTDADGYFVDGLERGDFEVFDEGEAQTITFFERERVPASVGIVLDTSGSMAGEKIESAQTALRRFIGELLGPDDEMFLIRFADRVEVAQPWTAERPRIEREFRRITTGGGTALFDAVVAATELASRGRHDKKALLIISDGNDEDSDATVLDARRVIRRSDVLVYAIGIDAIPVEERFNRRPLIRSRMPPPTYPYPIPRQPRGPGTGPGGQPRSEPARTAGDRVDVDTLRSLTDVSGGRTEIIQGSRNLDAATAGIADELSRQYFLGFESTRPRDGRWHEIDVFVRGRRDCDVRARSGYTAVR